MTNINTSDWLNEQDIPPAGGQPDMGMGGPPMTQPGGPGDPMNSEPTPDLNPQPEVPEDDINNDPQYPDMPEEETSDDFEVWKIKYVKESIKGDPQKLIDMLMSVRDRELEPIQRKFVEDNLSINNLRMNSNVLQASNEIRKRIKKDFDRTNPSTSVVGHISDVLAENPLLNEAFIKISGLGGGKMDYHRKYIGALTGSVQVGSGGQNEDLIFEETDYSIRISTRFNSRWGDVNIGRWHLKEDDPERFLKNAEIERLEAGSPEEKDVLRRRVVVESIADKYMERAFMITVVNEDGTIQNLGWDLGNCLKAAFLDGKLVVRTENNDAKEAFIDEQGSIIAVPNMSIYYVKESGELGEYGQNEIEEVEFIQHRDGMLFLSAPLDLVKESSVSLQGMNYKEALWNQNPSDFLRVQRCVPSLPEMLLRNC